MRCVIGAYDTRASGMGWPARLLYARLLLSCEAWGGKATGRSDGRSGAHPRAPFLGIFDLGKSAPGKNYERYAAPCNRYAVVITHRTRGAK